MKYGKNKKYFLVPPGKEDTCGKGWMDQSTRQVDQPWVQALSPGLPFRQKVRNKKTCVQHACSICHEFEHTPNCPVLEVEKEYIPIDTGAGGNCLFFAIAWALHGTTENTTESIKIRKTVVEYIVQNWEKYIPPNFEMKWQELVFVSHEGQPWCTKGLNKDTFRDNMTIFETNGGTSEYLAAHFVYNRAVNVFRETGQVERHVGPLPAINLFYTGFDNEGHWQGYGLLDG